MNLPNAKRLQQPHQNVYPEIFRHRTRDFSLKKFNMFLKNILNNINVKIIYVIHVHIQHLVSTITH